MPKAPARKANPTTADEPALVASLAEGEGVEQPTLDVDDWFVPLADAATHVNALYYGREGSTKTTSAARVANLPEPGRVLFINAEGGLKIAPLEKHGVDTSRIVVYPRPNTDDAIDFPSLDRIYRRMKADLTNDPTSWLAVVFDSETEIVQVLLDGVSKRRVDALKRKGTADVDEHFVDVADYGTMTKMARDLLRKFRDLPCHFIITALERRDVDKDTGKPQYGPAVTPGLAKDLLGYVDFVIMMKPADEDGPVRGLTRANSRFRAKDRFDVTPRIMVEPTVDRLFGYLNGTLTEDEDPFQTDLPGSAAPDAPPVSPDADGEDDGNPDDQSGS